MAEISRKLLSLPATDLKNYLSVVRAEVAQLEARKESLKTELYFQESEIPLQEESLQNINQSIEELSLRAEASSKNLLQSHKQSEQLVTEQAPELAKKLDNILALENLQAYLRAIEKLYELHDQLCKRAGAKQWTALCQSLYDLDNFIDTIQGTKCTNLLQFAKKFKNDCETELKLLLKNALTSCMQTLEFPFDVARDLSADQESTDEFRSLLTAYHKVHPIKTGDEHAEGDKWSSNVPIVELLLDPFRRRFHYHFYGDRKTNVLEKPEWFFTQILQWVLIHRPYIESNIQPILAASNLSVTLELARGLMGLAAEKVRNVLLHLVHEESNSLFCHLLDETVTFELEMIEVVNYPESEPNCLELFVEDDVLLEQWIQIENQANTEKTEELLANDAAWSDRYQQAANLDEFKVPECVDNFILLQQLITERYRLLRSVEARSKFLQLQLNLVNDFRMRLVQIRQSASSPWICPYPQIMNGVAYMAHVLRQWDDLPFFLQLHAHRTKATAQSGKRLSGAFEPMVDLLDHLSKQMLSAMCQSLVEGLSGALEPYKKHRWYSTDEPQTVTNVSASLCPALLLLTSKLTLVQQSLSAQGFQAFMLRINESVAHLLSKELLSQMSFSCQGATQMCYDVTAALLPLLLAYQSSATLLASQSLTRVAESLRLLSLPVPGAILLRDSVNKMPDDQLRTTMADDWEIFILLREDVQMLLKQRVDI